MSEKIFVPPLKIQGIKTKLVPPDSRKCDSGQRNYMV